MKFTQYLPNPLLKPFVIHYQFYEVAAGCDQLLFPSGHVEVACLLEGEPITTVIGTQEYVMPRIEILGQLTQPCRLHSRQRARILVIRFAPYASSLFITERLSDLHNHSVDFTLLQPRQGTELAARIYSSSSEGDVLQSIENYLIACVRNNERLLPKLRIVQAVCTALQEGRSLGESLSDRIGYSPRYVQRLFQEHVGISPKQLFRIMRFQRTLCELTARLVPLTAVAYDQGYYDQAHFIKDFKDFTGLTPSAYAASV